MPLLASYAVVTTDHARLHNNHTTHRYVASAVYVNDIYWSVVAGQKIFPPVGLHGSLLRRGLLSGSCRNTTLYSIRPVAISEAWASRW